MRIWSTLIEEIIWWLSWLHIKRQLPEDLGGGGRETFELGEGERLELVLIRPRMMMWLQWGPPANPKRKDEEGKPARGAPPLIFWPIFLPIFFVLLSFSLSMMTEGADWLKYPDLLYLAAASWALGLLCCLPIYWLYEWERRHYRLVMTNLMAYVIKITPITREWHRSPSPLRLLEEVILDSTWSEGQNLLARILGGWLQELRGLGDAWMGTRVIGAADIIRGFPHVSALGKIFQQLNRSALDVHATREVAEKLSREMRYRGLASSATAGLRAVGDRSAYEDAIRQAQAIIEAWRKEHPSGEKLNLLDPRILGFTRWNLETGEPLTVT